jgi:hypothetical protein
MPKNKSRSYGNTFKEWELITEACTANQADLQHVTAQRDELESLVAQARDALTQQAVHAAGREDMSDRLAQIEDQGSKLATLLRVAIKQRYGNRSSKLTEFGVQPRRPRRQSTSTQPPPGPEAPAPDPTPQS